MVKVTYYFTLKRGLPPENTMDTKFSKALSDSLIQLAAQTTRERDAPYSRVQRGLGAQTGIYYLLDDAAEHTRKFVSASWANQSGRRSSQRSTFRTRCIEFSRGYGTTEARLIHQR